jgi:uncharacterized protein (DUF1501 family)
MKQSRRSFLKRAATYGVGTALVTALRPFGTTAFADNCGSSNKTLVHIWLGGGPASHLLLAPSSSSSAFSTYATNNPSLGIGVGTNPSGLAISSSNKYVLHQSLSSIRDAMNSSLFSFKASLINYVGYPSQNYSHEESSNIIKFGSRNYSAQGTGWAGRLADQFCVGKDFSVFSFAGRSPVLWSQTVQPLLLDDLKAYRFSGDTWDGHSAFARQVFKNVKAGQDLNISDTAMKQALTAMDSSVEVMRSLVDSYENLASNQKAFYPTSNLLTTTQVPGEMHWFAKRLRDIAILIRSNRPPQFVTVELGGWDTHGDGDDRIPMLASQLNLSLKAFCEDLSLGSVADRAVILAHGEFGRNGFENASKGNDHGHGGMMLVLDTQARQSVLGPTEYNAIDFMKRGIQGSRGEIPGGYGYRRDDQTLVAGVDFREVLEQVIQKAGFASDQIFTEQFSRSGISIFT